MSSFSIRPVGFSESEKASLEAILTIARGTLSDDWRWTVHGSADVCLVAVESEADWTRYSAELSSSRLVACAPPALNLNTPWRIEREPEKLPPLRQITRTLNALGAAIASGEWTPSSAPSALAENAHRRHVEPVFVPGAATSVSETRPIDTEGRKSGNAVAGIVGESEVGTPTGAAPATASIPRQRVKPVYVPKAPAHTSETGDVAGKPGVAIAGFTAGAAPGSQQLETEAGQPPPVKAGVSDDCYDPAGYLIAIIREYRADGVPRRLSCTDGKGGILRIESGRAFCSVPGEKIALLPILSVSRNRIDVKLLSDTDLASEPLPADIPALAIDDLIFLSVLKGSQGRMWAGCRADETVRLKQWPNLSCLPDSLEYLKLAAFMSSNNANVQTIAEQTRTPVEQVIDFHNACMAVELLDRGGEAAVREKSINPSVRALYQKIAKRLQSEI